LNTGLAPTTRDFLTAIRVPCHSPTKMDVRPFESI